MAAGSCLRVEITPLAEGVKDLDYTVVLSPSTIPVLDAPSYQANPDVDQSELARSVELWKSQHQHTQGPEDLSTLRLVSALANVLIHQGKRLKGEPRRNWVHGT